MRASPYEGSESTGPGWHPRPPPVPIRTPRWVKVVVERRAEPAGFRFACSTVGREAPVGSPVGVKPDGMVPRSRAGESPRATWGQPAGVVMGRERSFAGGGAGGAAPRPVCGGPVARAGGIHQPVTPPSYRHGGGHH